MTPVGLLCAVSGFAQYTGGTVGSTGGYKSSTGIAIGAAAAAGVGVGYLALRHAGGDSGCVESGANGQMRLIGSKASNNYMLLNSASASLQPGERVKLKGKKVKGSSGEEIFEVRSVAKDYGPCKG
jgi:hypothetical protein